MTKLSWTTCNVLGLVMVLLLGPIACQQGKKEDGQSQVYTEVLDKCDLIEKQLEKEKVLLKVTPAKPSDLGEKLEFTLTTTPQDSKVQSLLEQYVVISQKLLEIGDTKVVLFPEKDRVQNSLNNALIYLGYLYAKSEGHGSAHAVQDKNSDYSEFTYRLARFSFYLKTLKDNHLPIDDFNEATKVMGTLKTEKLQQIISMSTVFMTDIFVIRALSEKNKNWILGSGLNVFSSEEASLTFSGLAWSYREQAKTILKSRETPPALVSSGSP